MRRIIVSLLLILAHVFLCSCASAPEELNRETVIGKWVGVQKIPLGATTVECETVFEFKPGGSLLISVDEDDLEDAIETMLEDDLFVRQNMGMSAAELRKMMEENRMTAGGVAAQLIPMVDTSIYHTYSFTDELYFYGLSDYSYDPDTGILFITCEEGSYELEYAGS